MVARGDSAHILCKIEEENKNKSQTRGKSLEASRGKLDGTGNHSR